MNGWWLRIFWYAEEELIDIRDNWLVPEQGDPGWVEPDDPGRAGWALRDDAKILRVTGFQPLPLKRIGLRRDEYRTSLPKKRQRARSA